MKKADVITIALALGFIIPILGISAITIHNDNMISSEGIPTSKVYLEPGPQYNATNKAGFITIDSNYTKSTDLQLNFNHISGTGTINLLNVLSVYNSNNNGTAVNIHLNGTLPSNVTMYIGTYQMVSSGTIIQGNNAGTYQGDFTVNLNTTLKGTDFYISFQVNPISNDTGDVGVYTSPK